MTYVNLKGNVVSRDLVVDFKTCGSHLKDTVRLAAFWGTVGQCKQGSSGSHGFKHSENF